jgi:aminopeptidase
MMDPRIVKLAEVLVDHSTRLQPGERVLLECFDLPDPALPVALIQTVVSRGAVPFVWTKQNRILRALWRHASLDMVQILGKWERDLMEQVQAYIGIRGAENVSEMSDVPPQQMDWYHTYIWRPVHLEVRVRKTKWVVLRYPTPSMAQLASMSTEAFEDFYFQVCTIDYQAMAQALRPLADLLRQTKHVRIVGPGTDLEFWIDGVGVVACAGEHNLPDGEVFTAPHRESVEGRIAFNTPTIYDGTTFENVWLEFSRGRVQAAGCSGDVQRLEQILNCDEGARYVGEFALGCHPGIRQPMKDILFDEKIAGSLHLALGNAYQEADNGNRSKIHWDLVLIQRLDYGGGEVYFDGQLVRQDGRFVLPELQRLNADF